MRSRGAPVLLVALLALVLAAQASAAPGWPERITSAARYAETRAGVESFAFVDDTGKLRGYRAARAVPSASVLKAMLLVAYLNRSSVRGRALNSSDRSLLAPMIRWSDNATATRILGIVGASGVYTVARRAKMISFQLRSPWGLSLITARDQARFFHRIDRLVPSRHRAYALGLLASVVKSQRWGIAAVKPPGWRIYFKGGWGSGTGAVTHQVALLRKGTKRMSLAVLTTANPNHTYGTYTVRFIARRILKNPLPLAP